MNSNFDIKQQIISDPLPLKYTIDNYEQFWRIKNKNDTLVQLLDALLHTASADTPRKPQNSSDPDSFNSIM